MVVDCTIISFIDETRKINDWDFKQIDDEILENLNNESIDTIGRVLEIEIYNHQGDLNKVYITFMNKMICYSFDTH